MYYISFAHQQQANITKLAFVVYRRGRSQPMRNFSDAAYIKGLRKQNLISTASSLQFCCISGNPTELYEGLAHRPLYILLYNFTSTCSQSGSGCANSNPDVYYNIYTSKCQDVFAFLLLPNERGIYNYLNPLNAELNSICYFLALLAHHFLHVSRIRVKSLTLRLLMSYIYIYIYEGPILDVSRSHTTTQHNRQDSSGRVISLSQRPLPDYTQHSQQKHTCSR